MQILSKRDANFIFFSDSRAMAAPRAAIRRAAGAMTYAPAISPSLRALFPRICIQTAAKNSSIKHHAMARFQRSSAPLVGSGVKPHGVRKVTNHLRSGMLRGRKMGERVPIFPKNECYQYPAYLHKHQIYCGFQGA